MFVSNRFQKLSQPNTVKRALASFLRHFSQVFKRANNTLIARTDAFDLCRPMIF
jgi:hypothetical protein